jgi:hypothetical protein
MPKHSTNFIETKHGPTFVIEDPTTCFRPQRSEFRLEAEGVSLGNGAAQKKFKRFQVTFDCSSSQPNLISAHVGRYLLNLAIATPLIIYRPKKGLRDFLEGIRVTPQMPLLDLIDRLNAIHKTEKAQISGALLRYAFG